MEKYVGDMQSLETCGFLNPFMINGMDEALERIINAVNNRQKIVIYGYYNLDGITAVSLLMLILKYLNADVEYFIPDNDTCETDISGKTVENYIRFLGANLMISVGCGINSFDEIELCKNLGIDVIITDYHKPCGDKPNTIIINPNDIDSIYPFKGLVGVGVAYKLAQAIAIYYQMKSINKYLDMVMIGTYSTTDYLEFENRQIVESGLYYLSCTHNYGLRALMKVNNIDCTKISVKDIKKIIKNMMVVHNPSRLGDNARIVVELLTTTSSDRAEQIAKYLKNETSLIEALNN